MIQKLKEEYDKAGLEINYNKTEYLQTNKIKGIEMFKQLGFTITQNGDTEEEIKIRLAQTRRFIRQLGPIIWNRIIHKITKHIIYKTMVRSIMTYGAVWVTKKKSKDKIRVEENILWGYKNVQDKK